LAYYLSAIIIAFPMEHRGGRPPPYKCFLQKLSVSYQLPEQFCGFPLFGVEERETCQPRILWCFLSPVPQVCL
jgi:hypothetical protein